MDEIDPRALRDAFGCFPTGITVVTTRETDGTPRGFTANSFTSVSLDPPLLLVCIAAAASSLPVFASAPHFAVNVLGDAQRAVSARFASRAPDKFGATDWQPGRHGAPLIGGALAWFECARHETVAAGDHEILIGRVLDFDAGEGNPLGYLRGSYVSHALEHIAVEAAAGASSLRIGAVIEAEGRVFLAPDPDRDGALRLPASGSGRRRGSLRGLSELLGDLGVVASLSFLFAVFEEAGGEVQSIYYRGTGTGEVPRRGLWAPLDALPLDRVGDPVSRAMLTRYAAERAAGRFGIYVGDDQGGEVRPLDDAPL